MLFLTRWLRTRDHLLLTPIINMDQARWAMRQALAVAHRASILYQEVPVGALLLRGETIVAAAANACRRRHVLAHAELRVLQRGLQRISAAYLQDCTLVVTLEPCLLCVGALLRTRVRHVIFGASDPRQGALWRIWRQPPSGQPLPLVTAGVCEKSSRRLLKRFFAQLRAHKSST